MRPPLSLGCPSGGHTTILSQSAETDLFSIPFNSDTFSRALILSCSGRTPEGPCSRAGLSLFLSTPERGCTYALWTVLGVVASGARTREMEPPLSYTGC